MLRERMERLRPAIPGAYGHPRAVYLDDVLRVLDDLPKETIAKLDTMLKAKESCEECNRSLTDKQVDSGLHWCNPRSA